MRVLEDQFPELTERVGSTHPLLQIRRQTRDALLHRAYEPRVGSGEAGLNSQWGLVENSHVPMIRDVLESASALPEPALDLGCGPSAERKRVYEELKKPMMYADVSPHILLRLKEGFDDASLKDAELAGRTYRILDKDKLWDGLSPASLSAIVRCGVGDSGMDEMAGLSAVLVPNGGVFVSNSIERQPAEDFVSAAERFFPSITVYMGQIRYAVVLSKAL